LSEPTSTQSLDQLIDSTVTIATIPSTLAEIQRIVEDPESSVDDASAFIETDAAVASRVLRMVNSAFYGRRTTVRSIQDACAILGLRPIHRLVIEATVLDAFRDGPRIDGFAPEDLWDHSFRAAIGARLLCEAAPSFTELRPDEAYACGLLHDVGRMVLLQSMPERFEAAVHLSRDRGMPLSRAEAEVFGFTAAEVFVRVARRWRLGREVQASVLRDLDRQQVPDLWPISTLVHAASALAHEAVAPDAPWIGDPFDPAAFGAMGVPDETVGSIRAEIAEIDAVAGGE